MTRRCLYPSHRECGMCFSRGDIRPLSPALWDEVERRLRLSKRPDKMTRQESGRLGGLKSGANRHRTQLDAGETGRRKRVGHAMWLLRIERGLSQREAAGLLHVSLMMVSRYERGISRVPAAAEVATAFGVTEDTVAELGQKAAW